MVLYGKSGGYLVVYIGRLVEELWWFVLKSWWRNYGDLYWKFGGEIMMVYIGKLVKELW